MYEYLFINTLYVTSFPRIVYAKLSETHDLRLFRYMTPNNVTAYLRSHLPHHNTLWSSAFQFYSTALVFFGFVSRFTVLSPFYEIWKHWIVCESLEL